MEKQNRLSSLQKKIIDKIKKNKILIDDVHNLKCLNVIHNKIKDILNELSAEPHEISSLIMNYNGNNTTFIKLKNIIIKRNNYILDNIYSSDKWNKNINKISNIFKKTYIEPSDGVIYMSCNDALYDILKNEVNTFDILQCKISIDDKYQLKSIFIIDLDDQMKIITNILKNKCSLRINELNK